MGIEKVQDPKDLHAPLVSHLDKWCAMLQHATKCHHELEHSPPFTPKAEQQLMVLQGVLGLVTPKINGASTLHSEME